MGFGAKCAQPVNPKEPTWWIAIRGHWNGANYQLFSDPTGSMQYIMRISRPHDEGPPMVNWRPRGPSLGRAGISRLLLTKRTIDATLRVQTGTQVPNCPRSTPNIALSEGHEYFVFPPTDRWLRKSECYSADKAPLSRQFHPRQSSGTFLNLYILCRRRHAGCWSLGPTRL